MPRSLARTRGRMAVRAADRRSASGPQLDDHLAVGESDVDQSLADGVGDQPEGLEDGDDVDAGGDLATSTPVDHDRRRFVRWVTFGGGLALVPLLAVLWDLRLDPMRTATPQGFFSNFYDIQARALMRGDLSVPPGSLSIEAFVVDGRHFMYFPPFPALIRIPFLWIGGTGLDGRLTAPFILLAWVVTTVVLSMLLWRLRRMVRPDTALGRGEAFAYGAFVLVATGGSILVFVAALPWVYHEAYAWGVAAALGTAFSLLGFIDRPSRWGALTTGVWATVAILSRTTSGWACAFAILMCAIWFRLGRGNQDEPRAWRFIAVAGLVPLVIGAGVNYAKFRHPWLFPLENQVWTEVNQHRRDALAANGGGLVGPQFFTTSLVNYFRPDGIRFTSIFPWITLPAEPARGYNGAFVDQMYRTGSVTAFMPGLLALAVTGFVASFRRGASDGLRSTRFPLIGMLGITTGVMFYGYLAHRYTAEFFPALAVGGAVGVVVCGRRLDLIGAAGRRTAVVAICLVTVFGVVSNTAVAFHASRTTYGGQALRDYVVIQERLSGMTGDPIDGFIARSDLLPPTGPTDQLRIIGDCDALYLSTGDNYQPWLPVEVRELVVKIRTIRDDEIAAPLEVRGSVELLTLDGIRDLTVSLSRVGRSTYRVLAGDGQDHFASPQFRAPPGFEFQVKVGVDIRSGRYTVTGPRSWGFARAMSSHADDWITQPTLIVPTFDPDLGLEQGLELTIGSSPEPQLCSELLGSLGGVDQ